MVRAFDAAPHPVRTPDLAQLSVEPILMPDPPSSSPPPALCPNCGYDLRGHPDEARCPECGLEVHVSLMVAHENKWVDRRLLDYWSIGIMQAIGTICAIVSVVAISQGQYVGVVAGMAAGVYMLSASTWFLVLTAMLLRRAGKPAYLTVHPRRRKRLLHWVVVDLMLVAVFPSLMVLVWKLASALH